jgi:hypothetical protein
MEALEKNLVNYINHQAQKRVVVVVMFGNVCNCNFFLSSFFFFIISSNDDERSSHSRRRTRPAPAKKPRRVMDDQRAR